MTAHQRDTTPALLAAARHLTDEQIDRLATKIDDELVGGDPRPTIKALRELALGNQGKPTDDPLD